MKKNGEIKVCLVGSSGGHLTHLYMLKPFWKDKDHFWVTFDKEDARSLLEYVTHVKAIFYYLKSKYVFYTAGQLPIKPSKSQKVIHLQHGITFKTCGKLTHINNGNEFFFTDCLATSNIYKPIYSKAFGCSEEKIYINSEPVTDVFFNGYKKYDLGNYNKIILWTPTFRQSDYLGYDDSETEELLPLFEEKDYSRLNEILKEYNFLLMVKIHPSQDLSRYSKLKFRENLV